MRAKFQSDSGAEVIADQVSVILDDGSPVGGLGGAVDVRSVGGTGGIIRPRTLSTAARDTAEFPAGAKIRYLEVICWPTVTSALSDSIMGMVAVDAPNDAVADSWLLGTDNIITSLTAQPASDAGNFILIPVLKWLPIPVTEALKNGAGGGGRVDVRTNDNTTALNWLIRGS